MKNEDAKREYRAQYNSDRECYISADGKYVCYDTWDSDQKKIVTIKIEVGKDGVTEELTYLIDDLNYDMDLSDRYYGEAKDPLFEAKRQKYESDPEGDEAVDPWETVSRPQDEPGYMPDEQPENPDLAKVRKSVDEDLTDAQRDLYYDHFGMGRQLEEIRQEEVADSGKDKSLQSVLNRKNKIIAKVAHRAFGAEPVKRKKTRKED